MPKPHKRAKEEKDEPPYTVFKYCKDQCFACNECGLFYGPGAGELLNGQHVPERENSIKLHTADTVRLALAPKWDSYYAKLLVGQPPTWVCDDRTKELFCLSQWLMEVMTVPEGGDVEDKHRQLWFWNRKARAEGDLYALAALTANNYRLGKIDQYKGK
jgi:hypothetical protein